MEHALQQFESTLTGVQLYRIRLPTTMTQKPAALVNFIVEKLQSFLDPSTIQDPFAELLADPNFHARKQQRKLERLRRNIRGAFPLPSNIDEILAKKFPEINQPVDDTFASITVSPATTTTISNQYAPQLDVIRGLLTSLLMKDSANTETPSAHIVFELDHFDTLAHKTKRQTFLYSFLELMSVCPSKISVILSTCRADVFSLLEKRVASRLPQRNVMVEPPRDLDHMTSLYDFWLTCPRENESGDAAVEAWNDSVSSLLRSFSVATVLEDQLSICSNINYYRSHVILLLSDVDRANPAVRSDRFGEFFDKYLCMDPFVESGKSLPRLEIIVLAAARNLEVNMKDPLINYSFEDIYQEYLAIIELARSGIHSTMLTVLERHLLPRHLVLNAFESLLDMRFFEFRSNIRGANPSHSMSLAIQYRPVRTTLTQNQLDQIIRFRREELDFLKSNKF